MGSLLQVHSEQSMTLGRKEKFPSWVFVFWHVDPAWVLRGRALALCRMIAEEEEIRAWWLNKPQSLKKWKRNREKIRQTKTTSNRVVLLFVATSSSLYKIFTPSPDRGRGLWLTLPFLSLYLWKASMTLLQFRRRVLFFYFFTFFKLDRHPGTRGLTLKCLTNARTHT